MINFFRARTRTDRDCSDRSAWSWSILLIVDQGRMSERPSFTEQLLVDREGCQRISGGKTKVGTDRAKQPKSSSLLHLMERIPKFRMRSQVVQVELRLVQIGARRETTQRDLFCPELARSHSIKTELDRVSPDELLAQPDETGLLVP